MDAPRGLVKLSKILNLNVIAEGVETSNQFNILKDIDCTLIQGYYFSKPLPASEMEKLLAKGNLTPNSK